MPRVVLLAKSVYVWLAQLSAECGRTLTTLSDIPDDVLDGIAARGFTALWLIGVWRRSPASATIKKRQGTSDAIASAYSIDSYAIDDTLGGQAAYENLRARMTARGIRLAADLVPNHMGIDSEWVRNHPDYFVQTETCPYEGYRFSVDVSSHPDVGTFLEDGYWSRTDAAIVFKRVDRQSGKETFIYHGNDGTSMPWNDTAQLDYTRASVRTAMLDLIVAVARMFPILRFDAAMTLAKQHYQRLWFPHHGGGEAIASRGRFAMSQAEFDRAMPREFWSEVVDAVAERAPDTLLLAEAFWMMEGYFVRSLGMHRVYNSAFMNMFKAEENAKYHELIRNVIEYDPEILGRFVNFMNNPDEEPAAVQFGTTDKYFAVCTLLATLPGTPMFGHGQFEGLREKYGMEFYRPMQDETVDGPLLAAHDAKIVPLLRRRFVFAQARSFRLFPLQTEYGNNPNVFAFCNAHGDERALVLVHNRYETARGRLSRSAQFRGDDGTLVDESLVDALFGGHTHVTLVHATTGQEWRLAREGVQREGLFVELGPYAHDVWWVTSGSDQAAEGDHRVDADATIASNRDSAFSSVAIEGPNEKRT
jgi:glycosidase